MALKVGLIYLGCAKNLIDSETMIGILADGGYEITPEENEADIIIVNTCAFIDSAKEEAINTILDVAELKNNKLKALVVTGCLSQRYGEEVLKEFPEVDAILGTNDYDKILQAVEKVLSGERFVSVSDKDDHITETYPRISSMPSHVAYLKIADGCDNHCTYCIIPKLRGKYRSRPMDEIIYEAKCLADNGVKEIILVAQDTAYYGFSDLGGYKLHILLKELSKIEKIQWIRLQYCYPENITHELIEVIATNPKVVHYLDMPLQHISDSVLKRMGRKSREKEIYALISELRERIPDIVLRTSLITGFPGETNEDYIKMAEFLKIARIDRAGIFKYSREEGTGAYSFGDQIDEETKEERYDTLMLIQQEVSRENNLSLVGKRLKVIIEDYDFDELCYMARTYGDTPDVDMRAYVFSKDELNQGDIVEMTVLQSTEYDLTGEVTDEFTK